MEDNKNKMWGRTFFPDKHTRRGHIIFADKHIGWGQTIYKDEHTDLRGDAQVTKTNTHNFGTYRALYIDYIHRVKT